MAFGMSYEEARHRKKRMKKNAKHIKNPRQARNLLSSFDNALKLREGEDAVEELQKEVMSEKSSQSYSGKYPRSCGFGEGKRGVIDGKWVEVKPGVLKYKGG